MIDTRVGVYGLIVRDGSILLSHWTAGDRWMLPGGGMEPGEQPDETAVREIREETGYDASLGRILGVDAFLVTADRRMHGDGPLQGVRIVYAAVVTGGELTHEVDGSSDEARWVPLDALARLRTSDMIARALDWAAQS